MIMVIKNHKKAHSGKNISLSPHEQPKFRFSLRTISRNPDLAVRNVFSSPFPCPSLCQFFILF
jgi:hypothetical protein